MKPASIFILISIAMVLSCSTFQVQQEIEIKAGEYNRPQAPMYTDILLPSVSTNMPVCLSDGKHKIPGQIENLGSGLARVWWLQSAMQAGETQNWTIFIGKSCGKTIYSWTDTTGNTMVLDENGQPVLEYDYPAFDPNQADLTQRPFHQVYSPDGSELITKGLGGLHPHHRGIFFGYRDVSIGDSTVNFWSTVNGSHTVHQALVNQTVGPVFGGHTVNIEWTDGNQTPLAMETRTLRTFRLEDGSMLVDFETRLKSMGEPMQLGGNRHHAGVQFRAAQDVAEHQETTRFLRPEPWAQYPQDAELDESTTNDMPWDAMLFNIGNNNYTVVYFSAPSNPGPADMGERKYGRIGEYIPWALDTQTPLELHYRFWVLNGHIQDRDKVQTMYNILGEPIEIISYN